jgi:WD40 repeat protein
VADQTMVAHLVGQDAPVMDVEFLDASTLVSTGDDLRDKLGDSLGSALKVWSIARRDVTVGAGRVKRVGVSVKDDGTAVISWATEAGDTGTEELFIGEDGALHRPTEPVDRAHAVDGVSPNWAAGGRSIVPARKSDPPPTAAVTAEVPTATTPPQTKQLASLTGGLAKLYGGDDGTLQLWGIPRAGPGKDAAVPILLRSFRGHDAPVIAAGVSPSGRFIVSADERGRLLAWDLLRPLRCRDFELRLSSAYARQRDARAGLDTASLVEWFKFRGFPIPTSESEALSGRGSR